MKIYSLLFFAQKKPWRHISIVVKTECGTRIPDSAADKFRSLLVALP